MRPGLAATVAIGMVAIVARALAPAPLADLAALVYLVSATSTFGPRWSSAAVYQRSSARKR